MHTSFYSDLELSRLGFKSIGENVLLSKKCSIYSPEEISIGENVRIDDFCILSGRITLGSHIHISAYSALYGSHGIVMEDFSGLSARTTIFSAMDDFSGEYLIGPIHEKAMTNVRGGVVFISKYVQVGVNCVVFPDLRIGEGTVIGAMSFVNKTLEGWGVYVGIPVRRIKERSNGLLRFLE